MTEKLVLCRTGRKRAEFPSDIEILIRQAISAVPKNLSKIELSSDTQWTGFTLRRTRLKLAECTKDTKIMVNEEYELRPPLSAKLSSHVTRNGEKLSCVIQDSNFEEVKPEVWIVFALS